MLQVDNIGDVTITNDGATILKQLEVEHPAAKVLVDLAQLQDEEVGDGTTSVVIIAAELLRVRSCYRSHRQAAGSLLALRACGMPAMCSGCHSGRLLQCCRGGLQSSLCATRLCCLLVRVLLLLCVACANDANFHCIMEIPR